MNAYDPTLPRSLFALAAVALAVVTISLSVVLPAMASVAATPWAVQRVPEIVIAAARESLVFLTR